MKNKQTFGTPAKVILAALLFCGLASANAAIVVTGVDWNRGGSFWMNGDGSDFDAYFGGVINITLTENGHSYDRDTLCVDLFTDIYIGGSYQSNVVTPNDIPGRNLKRVAWLVDNALVPADGPSVFSELPTNTWVDNAVKGAGIQYAIWDIVHDGGDGFSSGRVQAATDHTTDPGILAWAQYYEAQSAGKSSNLAYVYLNAEWGNGNPAQTLEGPIFLDGGPAPTTSTPEPGTLVLAGGVLITIGVMGQRKRRASLGRS